MTRDKEVDKAYLEALCKEVEESLIKNVLEQLTIASKRDLIYVI